MGFPAHAGMDPSRRRSARGSPWLPRTRGDGPVRRRSRGARVEASPHTRGWTGAPRRPTDPRRGFPAHAGMDPAPTRRSRTPSGLPRTRGDGPSLQAACDDSVRASPHTRGWTRAVWPHVEPAPGFPAHAGMDPSCTSRRSRCAWLPRTRGDGPPGGVAGGAALGASPHTRGWTREKRDRKWERDGFPAHAGMDPHQPRARPSRVGLPRTRGDGPRKGRRRCDRPKASPHTRGWTSTALEVTCAYDGFPAHAGMDPRRRSSASARPRHPRTRGDGPEHEETLAFLHAASPHTRGWTQHAPRSGAPIPGFPAHAGMDLR